MYVNTVCTIFCHCSVACALMFLQFWLGVNYKNSHWCSFIFYILVLADKELHAVFFIDARAESEKLSNEQSHTISTLLYVFICIFKIQGLAWPNRLRTTASYPQADV